MSDAHNDNKKNCPSNYMWFKPLLEQKCSGVTPPFYSYSPLKIENKPNDPYMTSNIDYSPPNIKNEGTKFDDGKTEYCYMSPIFIEELNKVLTFGAKKYEAHNWRKGFKWSRVISALFRHIYAWVSGVDKDPETGISHLAHAACCIMFLVEFEKTHKELDDRYKHE
jgi:hypothetical protein